MYINSNININVDGNALFWEVPSLDDGAEAPLAKVHVEWRNLKYGVDATKAELNPSYLSLSSRHCPSTNLSDSKVEAA